MAKYPDNCPACGKTMETLGLSQTYAPKQLPEDGVVKGSRWECPHCRTAVAGSDYVQVTIEFPPGSLFEELKKVWDAIEGRDLGPGSAARIAASIARRRVGI